MNTLFVAMQDQGSRRWAPVGRLTRNNGLYRFVYTRGCRQVPDFEAFSRLTDLDAEYVSADLFPLFANRILPKVRPEYRRYMQWLGLNQEENDALDELGRTGGVRATDALELIPCPEPTEDQRYEILFFARGLRHLPPECQASIEQLQVGQPLFPAQDVQNDRDTMALMLRTGEPVQLVGYVPRYYANDVRRLLDSTGAQPVRVQVDAVNRDAPMQYRLRCRLSAPWPVGFVACGAPEFQPLSAKGAVAPRQIGIEPSDATTEQRAA